MARKRARISGDDVFAPTDLTGNQYAGKSTSQQDIKYPKTKVTYYVPEDLADRIDTAHLNLRRIVQGRKRKLSKSDLATAALELALKEFEQHGENSQLIDMLSNP